MAVHLLLNGDLCSFLAKGSRQRFVPVIELERRTSIKDFLEALGIPHPEIHRLLVNGEEKDFNYIVAENDQIEVFAVPCSADLVKHSPLTPALHPIRFAVDANVGKLARLLRMTGFDTFYDPGLADAELVETAWLEKRVLLTRDRALLKRKKVIHGRLIRHSKPAEQLREVIALYGLRNQIIPFSRCLRCNGVLQTIDKEKITARLQPLTRKYYDAFMICRQCDRLYWPGSHRERMLKLIEEL